MSVRPGQTLAERYVIGKLLAKGGMGLVYHAHDMQVDRPVAIKVMTRNLSADPNLRKRFVQEAEAVRPLDHPNIVRVLDFSAEGDPYIVMELIDSGTLREYLNVRQEVVPLDVALDITIQMADALDYAHTRQVIHRDIKPENILLSATNKGLKHFPYKSMLSDFGLAKLMNSAGLTQTGQSLGTVMYSSPEQRSESGDVDPRSDVFSLGVVLYELVTGQLPYDVDGPSLRMRALLQSDVNKSLPLDPRHLRPEITPRLERVLHTSLSYNRELRYQSAGDMMRELQLVQSELNDVHSTQVDLDLSTSADMSHQTEPPAAPQGTPTPPVAPPFMPQPAPAQQQLPPSAPVQRQSPPAPQSATSPQAAPPSAQQPAAQVAQPSGSPLPSDVDRIRVTEPNRKERLIPVSGDYMRIGRAPEMDIVLSEPYISREHARVQRNAQGVYRIQDLGSVNPVQLDDQPLMPNFAPVWKYGKSLRVGNAVLVLEPAPDRGIQLDEDAHRIHSEDRDLLERVGDAVVEGQTVTVKLHPPNLTVTPGEEVKFSVVMTNKSPQMNRLALDVRGVPAEWVGVKNRTVTLEGRQEVETILTFQPPRDADSRASRHTFTLHVRSLTYHLEVCRVVGILHLKPFEEFALYLHPHRLDNSGIMRLRITNQGNVRTDFHVRANDPEDGLLFNIHPAMLGVDPGEMTDVEIEVMPKLGRLVHGAKDFRFVVSVTTADETTRTLIGHLRAISNKLHHQQSAPVNRVPQSGVVHNNYGAAMHAGVIQPPVVQVEPRQQPLWDYESTYDDDEVVIPADEQPSEQFSPRINRVLLGLGVLVTILLAVVIVVLGVQVAIQARDDITTLLVLGPVYLIALGFTAMYGAVVLFAWRGFQWASYALLLLTTLLLPLIVLVLVIGLVIVG